MPSSSGEPCDVNGQSCVYSLCQPGCPVSPSAYAQCDQGRWAIFPCNPPNVVYCPPDAAPDVSDAGPDVYEGGPDVHDAGPDGGGQDGGRD
jgi:hypothetical protein